VNLQTAAQHAELMRKVETLNLLQDSNHHLRDEHNRLCGQLQEVEAKVSGFLKDHFIFKKALPGEFFWLVG